MNPRDQALAKPQSKTAAIRAMCWDCLGRGADGNWQKAIRECEIVKCPLHHVRPYQKK